MWHKNRFRSLYTLFLIIITFSFLTRSILLIKSLSSLALTPLLLAKIYGVGLFFDCVTFGYFAVPFLLVAMLTPDKVFNSRLFKVLSGFVLFVITYLMLFNVISEYTFFDEFATRYNFIAVDYLIYTSEVIRNIRESYPVNWLLGGILFINVFVFLVAQRHLAKAFGGTTRIGRRFRTGCCLLLLPVASFFFVDISMNHISPNNYADELASNGVYNLAAAFRNNELDFNKFYAAKDTASVMTSLRKQIRETDNHFISNDPTDITRVIQRQGTEKKLNVIVIIEESLSASFLGTFGNKTNITPNLDKLATESLFFTNLYATGTRTVRGLEAITLAIPPLPGTSIVKRPNNENFFSWGSVMKEKGYDNKFIYAGHGYFDNMNAFFAGNGFSTVDRLNFTNDEVTFTNAWGVCDEDLFMKVIKEGDKSYTQKKPFFSAVMTTSNHRPFTYPDGKIDLPSKSGRDGGVKYADYAIGRLLTEAKKKPWFNDTVFVIVADHCAGVSRKMALPVKDYRIPLLIYAPAKIKPQKIDRMMSQIDIAPTVIGLLNLSYTTRFFGKDILHDEGGQERAFISTYQKLGYIEGNRLLVLGPKKETGYYAFTRGAADNDKTVEIKPQEDLLMNGLGYYQGAYYVYKNRLNRLVK